MRQFIIFIFSIALLTSCAPDPDGYLKRSANNKLIDTKGFDAHKRRPLYNKKYIDQAKKNILENNISTPDENYDDDLSELEDTYRKNREMYLSMIEADIAKREQKELKNQGLLSKILPNKMSHQRSTEQIQVVLKDDVKSIKEANESKEELLKQISEIKSLLLEANETIASIRNEKKLLNDKYSLAENAEPSSPKAKAQVNKADSAITEVNQNSNKASIKLAKYSETAKNKSSDFKKLPKLLDNSNNPKNVVLKGNAHTNELPNNVKVTSAIEVQSKKTDVKSEIGFTEDELVLLREVHISEKPTLNESTELMTNNIKARLTTASEVNSPTKEVEATSQQSIKQPSNIQPTKASTKQLKARAKAKLAKVEKSIQKAKILKKKAEQVQVKHDKALIKQQTQDKQAAEALAKQKQLQITKEQTAQQELAKLPWLDEEIATLTPTNEIIITKKDRK